jgi:hypothetical protein
MSQPNTALTEAMLTAEEDRSLAIQFFHFHCFTNFLSSLIDRGAA